MDCANGVGSTVMEEMIGLAGFSERLQITMINFDKSPAKLNDECGAEHVQKAQTFPTGWSKEAFGGKKCISFDGDADRQIYFYGDHEGKFFLIDGDKQFALIMMYIKGLLAKLNLEDKLSHILVQTAYCNSRVTDFLNKNNIKNQLVKTGVKYAHPVVKHYDIGANNEPNGHGTVAYNVERLNEVLEGNNSLEAQKLRNILELSNVVVGDSIANLLIIEAILYDLDLSVEQFASIYKENPSKLSKCQVKDRGIFKTNEDETRLLQPQELQDHIDAAVASVTEGKAFVRASGTEDVVRIYAEAKTVAEMDSLEEQIMNKIKSTYV